LLFRNVLFDLDGTLTDPKDGITRCIQYSLDRLGRPAPATNDLLWCIGPPLRGSFATLLDSTDDALLDRALALYRERFGDVGLFENVVYPGIPSALADIQAQGFRLFLATSKPEVYAKQILEHFGLTPHFLRAYGAELDGRRTNKVELVAYLLQQESLDSRETLMVGDRLHDIAGGKQNGTATAAVTYGYGSADEIADAGPDYTFDTPEALAAFLRVEGRG
jgi:phosphoglycolate phosphatase